jgi:hypothetical protein
LRKAQDQLIGAFDGSTSGNVDDSVEISSAATALKDERLTFVWLDGEVQKVDFRISNFTFISCFHTLPSLDVLSCWLEDKIDLFGPVHTP